MTFSSLCATGGQALSYDHPQAHPDGPSNGVSRWSADEAEIATAKLDQLADLRDFIAYGRDRHAAALDRDDRDADLICESVPEMRARAQAARERAAADRVHAAADREAAARDRVVAAEARRDRRDRRDRREGA